MRLGRLLPLALAVLGLCLAGLPAAAQSVTAYVKPDGSGYQNVDATHPLPAGAAISPTVTAPSTTLTLPATTTAYAAGTLLCTSATVATCNTALQSETFAISNAAGAAAINRLRLFTNDATSTAWGGQTLQVDFWDVVPTFATTGDRGVFATTFLTGTGHHLGAFTCVMSAELADGAYAECAPTVGSFALPKLASGTTVYWTLQAITGSGVTGASKVWTLIPELMN